MYNAMGNLIKQINPDDTYKQVSYDIPNNDITTTDENGNATTKAYSPMGLLEKVYYGNNFENTMYEYEYDNKGRLLKDISCMYPGTAGMIYEYTYDDLDRVATKTTKSEKRLSNFYSTFFKQKIFNFTKSIKLTLMNWNYEIKILRCRWLMKNIFF